MWRFVKAELSYNRNVFMAFCSFTMLTFVTITNMELSGITVDTSVSQTIALSIMILFLSQRFNEKRTRLIQVMPFTQKQMAVGRISYQMLFWIIAMLLYTISQFPLIGHHPILWRILLFNFTFIAGNAAYLICLDIWGNGFQLSSLNKMLISMALWFSIIIVNLLYVGNGLCLAINNPVIRRWTHIIYLSAPGAIVLHLLGIGLTLLSMQSFLRRHAYLA
ncbi:hypothetical protein JW960_10500 [candidate division KSB1 bacterium]|nr:hypothetical protein [candidate division KSB1 bacterium]